MLVSSRRGAVEAPVHVDHGAATRPRVHDAALPRRGRDEQAHDRGQRPEVGDGRVQGHGRSGSRSCRGCPRPPGSATPSDGGAVDLHLTSAVATDEERAAVDALLGPPETGWVGGERDGGVETRFARGGRVARERRDLLLPALHALQSGARMDQRGRAELRLPAPDRPAGRGVRGRDVLRDVQRRAAAEDGGARVRRPRVPGRRRRPLRRAGANRRPAEHGRVRRGGLVGAEPVPRHVRTGPRGPRPACGRARGRCVRSRDRDADPERAHGRHARGGVRSAERPDRRVRAPDVGRRLAVRPAAACGASASSIRRRSTTIGRTAGTRRCAAPTSSDPRDVIREVTDAKLMGRGGAAFPTGREVEGGRRAVRASRTTSSATPTSPSPARSRTGS